MQNKDLQNKVNEYMKDIKNALPNDLQRKFDEYPPDIQKTITKLEEGNYPNPQDILNWEKEVSVPIQQDLHDPESTLKKNAKFLIQSSEKIEFYDQATIQMMHEAFLVGEYKEVINLAYSYDRNGREIQCFDSQKEPLDLIRSLSTSFTVNGMLGSAPDILGPIDEAAWICKKLLKTLSQPVKISDLTNVLLSVKMEVVKVAELLDTGDYDGKKIGQGSNC